MKAFVAVAVVLFGLAGLCFGQTPSQSNTPALVFSVELSIAAPVRPGAQGTLLARFRNSLQPRPPIQLQAVATYEFGGQVHTVSSNVVTIQVVQPIEIRQLNLRLPSSVSVGGGITFPMDINVTLTEGQEHVIRVPITVN